MFDWIRAAPGISATSPSSGTTTTIPSCLRVRQQRKTSSSSTAPTRPARVTAWPARSRAWTSSRKCRSSQSAPRRSSATCKVRWSMSSPGREATAFSTTRCVLWPAGRPHRRAGETTGSRFSSRAVVIIATDITTRPRTSADLPSAIACGSSAGTRTCAITTASPAPTRICREFYEQNKLFDETHLAPRAIVAARAELSLGSHGPIPSSRRLSKPFETTLRTRGTVPAITFGAPRTPSRRIRCGMCGWAASTTHRRADPVDWRSAGHQPDGSAG